MNNIDYFDKNFVLTNLKANITKSIILDNSLSESFKTFLDCSLYITTKTIGNKGKNPCIFTNSKSLVEDDIDYIHTSHIMNLKITKRFDELCLITRNSVYAFYCVPELTKQFIYKDLDRLVLYVDLEE